MSPVSKSVLCRISICVTYQAQSVHNADGDSAGFYSDTIAEEVVSETSTKCHTKNKVESKFRLENTIVATT